MNSLPPATKLQLELTPLIRSIKLEQVTFYVTSHEGSVVSSCETSLRLSLIHPCSNLDQIPDCASLIYSNADHPMKRKSKKSVQGKYVNQCSTRNQRFHKQAGVQSRCI